MLNVYLVSYDIKDPKRWRKVYQVMRGCGDRVQYSVFMCLLSSVQKQLLVNQLDAIVKKDEDQVMLINLGRGRDVVKSRMVFIGQPSDIPDRQTLII